MKPLDPDLVRKIKDSLIKAKSILLMAHRRPDGDTLGANLALLHYVEGLGKRVNVHCLDSAPASLSFIPGSSELIHECNPSDYDLFISCDAADEKQTGLTQKHPVIFTERKNDLINIDHHPSNTNFGGMNLVYPNLASSTQVVYYLLKEFSAAISPAIATCLLTGLYTDTGSYQHANTSSETFRIGAELLRYGANLKVLAKTVFRTTPISAMRLWGKAMSRIKTTPDGVAVSAIKQRDFLETGATKDDLSGLIDYLKFIPDISYANLITEEEDKVKISLRTIRDDVDLAKIAVSHGGGGHVKAAGFSIDGRLEEQVSWKIVTPENEEREVY